MALTADSDGFLVGGAVEEWRKANSTWSKLLSEVRAIRALLEGRTTRARRGSPGAPAVPRRVRARGAMPPDALERIERSRAAAAVRDPSSRQLPPSRRPPARGGGSSTSGSGRGAGGSTGGQDRGRDSLGRFRPGAGRPPDAPPSAAAEAEQKAEENRKNKGLADAIRAAFDGPAGDGNIDPVLAAASEIKEVVEPFGRVFGKLFGSDKEKKKEGRFKKITDLLKSLPEKIAERIGTGGGNGGGGLLGLLSGAAAPVAGLAMAALRRVPVIGAAVALGAGYLNDRSLAASGAGTEARVSNAARTAGDLGGVVGGTLLGAAIAGPFGAALGSVLGPILVRGLTAAVAPLLGGLLDFFSGPAFASVREMASQAYESVMKSESVTKAKSAYESTVARTSSTIEAAAERVTTSVESFKNSAVVQSAVSAYRTTMDSVTSSASYLAKLGVLESSGNATEDSQRRKFLRTDGEYGSTASGLHQFLDETFADQVARNGASVPAAAGLVGTAKAYLADPRSTLKKARDTKSYGALFKAKLNPEIAGPLAATFTEENRRKLAAAGITSPTDAQLYSVHLTGSTKAAKAFAANPRATAMSVFGEAAVSKNQELLGNGRTVGEVFGAIDARLDRAGAALPSMPMQPLPQFRPPNLAPLPEPPKGRPAMNTQPLNQKPTVLGPQQDEGQDLRDRRMALIATGGLSGG